MGRVPRSCIITPAASLRPCPRQRQAFFGLKEQSSRSVIHTRPVGICLLPFAEPVWTGWNKFGDHLKSSISTIWKQTRWQIRHYRIYPIPRLPLSPLRSGACQVSEVVWLADLTSGNNTTSNTNACMQSEYPRVSKTEHVQVASTFRQWSLR